MNRLVQPWHMSVAYALALLVPLAAAALIGVMGALAPGDLTVLGPALQHGSLPSGPAVAAGLFAGVVFLACRHALARALGIGLALLIALSRSAVGVHWHIDTLVGLAVGGLCAWVGWHLVANVSWATLGPQARVLAGATVGACGIALLFHPAGLAAATPYRYALALLSVALACASFLRGVVDRRPLRAAGAHEDIEEAP